MNNSERNEAIMEGVSGGATYAEVAASLGVSRNVVAGVVHRNREIAPNPVKANARRLNPVCSDD